MQKSLFTLMATMALSANALDAQILTANVENIDLWNYTTTAWKDYQVNETQFDITAENLTENISWVMQSSGKNKGSYLNGGSTRFELINKGLYEANSGSLAVRVTSKEAGIFQDTILLTSGDIQVRIPVCLKVAGTEGSGYWYEDEYSPLTVADANLIHDIMPANSSYATDATHSFDTYGGDYGYRVFSGNVASTSAADDQIILTDQSGKTLTLVNAGLDTLTVNANDIVTVEADLADINGVCALQSITYLCIESSAVANPAVTMEPASIEATSFSLTFTPNEATSTYHCCLFGEGELEIQFNMFGAWMGFTCYGDMITSWGYACEGVQTKQWKDLNPNTTYEIYVQPLDQNGQYGELQCFTVTTGSQGGSGASVISIAIGAFGGEDEIGHWQQVIYTPNDQTAVFYDLIITDEYYQFYGSEGVKQLLMDYDDPTDPNYSYYAQFKEDNAFWNADPATTYHACAIGKNANGEWGEMAEVIFSTPGTTAIQQVEATIGNSRRYNLNGQQTQQKQGLTIHNGRVMLVK